MGKRKKLAIIILLFFILIAGFPKDTNRHPITGTLINKYQDDVGIYHFVLDCGDFTQDIREVPREVYDEYRLGENMTITIRGNQYRYIGDVN